MELWIGKARESIAKIPKRTVFVAKDLFEGYEWNGLSRGDKLSFGRTFKNTVTSGGLAGVRYLGKRDNNSAEYMKE